MLFIVPSSSPIKSQGISKGAPQGAPQTLGPSETLRSLVGRLQHASQILPAAKAFFTPLNEALQMLPSFVGLRRHGKVRKALLDASALIQELARRPTHVSKLVDREADYIGFCDASAFGAGGVWFSGGKLY
jgi:hypothetical protein